MSTTNATVTNKRCRCAGCGEVFSALSNFDKHRQGKHSEARYCVHPESVGLVVKDGPNGSYWASPAPEKDWRKSAQSAESQP